MWRQTVTDRKKPAWKRVSGRLGMSLRPELPAVWVCLAAVFITFSAAGISRAAGTVDFSDGRISIHADNEPLICVLEKIAVQAGIVIFIAKGFEPGDLTLHLEDQPLEKALDRVLRGLNVARIYRKKPSGVSGLSAVEIYPGDRYGGPVDVIVSTGVPEPEAPPSPKGTRYESMRDDTLQPRTYVRTLEYDSLTSAALMFEKRENDAWQAVQDLKTQVNEEVDETINQVLSLALLDRYGEFEQMQQHHIDVLEKMHRMEHFMEKQTAQNN